MDINVCNYFISEQNFLILVEHFIESVVQLTRDSVDLELLSDNLIFQFINSQVELADVHLCVLRPGLSLLESDVDLLDLVLVLLLASPGLFLGYLQLFLVLSNRSQLSLNNLNTSLGILNPLISTLQFILHHGE